MDVELQNYNCTSLTLVLTLFWSGESGWAQDSAFRNKLLEMARLLARGPLLVKQGAMLATLLLPGALSAPAIWK